MNEYVKSLTTKELTVYIDFLKRMKLIGNDFLLKGDMWCPSIKCIPGVHIGRCPLLKNVYAETSHVCEPICVKYQCTHLEDTLKSIGEIRGRKSNIIFQVNQDEITLTINDTQWVIASKFTKDTIDLCPDYNNFESIINGYSWSEFSSETLIAIQDGHPVTINGILKDTGKSTKIRLAKNLFPLMGVMHSMEYTGFYTLEQSNDFDSSVSKIIIRMNYPKIECAHIYYICMY